MSLIRIPDDGGDTMVAMDTGDFIGPMFSKSIENMKDIFDNIPNFQSRDDDIMLCTFPKTGTNWVFENIMMLLRGSADRIDRSKVNTMLEFMTHDEVNSFPSPRVINTHYPPRFLPKDLVTKRIKTVLCVRNPKDTAVSYYNHMSGIKFYEYSGKWENWIRPFVQGKYELGTYSAYLNEWQEVIEAGTGFPLHVMYFEDLKKDPASELNKLANFLGIEACADFKAQIIDMCDFEKMAKDKFSEEAKKLSFKGEFTFFRKGQVGDWKNWFTVAQNEYFDAEWKKQIREDTMFKFTYD